MVSRHGGKTDCCKTCQMPPSSWLTKLPTSCANVDMFLSIFSYICCCITSRYFDDLPSTPSFLQPSLPLTPIPAESSLHDPEEGAFDSNARGLWVVTLRLTACDSCLYFCSYVNVHIHILAESGKDKKKNVGSSRHKMNRNSHNMNRSRHKMNRSYRTTACNPISLLVWAMATLTPTLTATDTDITFQQREYMRVETIHESRENT